MTKFQAKMVVTDAGDDLCPRHGVAASIGFNDLKCRCDNCYSWSRRELKRLRDEAKASGASKPKVAKPKVAKPPKD